MFSMRKFFALVFMVLMWVNLAWAENFYYVESDGNGDTIKYAVVENGSGYDSSQWSKTAVQTETTLTALFEKICYGGTTHNADAIVEKATVYLKAGTYNVKSFIHIQGKTASNVYKVYGGFAGSESDIDARDTSANKTILDGSGLTYTQDTRSYVCTTHLSSIVYINMSNQTDSAYRNDQNDWGNTAQATVTLDGLTLQNGGKNCTGEKTTDQFAATFFGGAIRIEGGNVTINDCDIKDNKSVGSGAGIYIDSGNGANTEKVVTTITNCNITNNIAAHRGGGGGICVGSTGNDQGMAIIKNCNISDNESNCYYGGGIFIWYGWVTEMDGCTIMNNKAYGGTYGGYGGGITVYSSSASEVSSITMTNCTIAGNTADKGTNNDKGQGGGLWIGANSKATITNCTIINNSATKGTEIMNYGDENNSITNSLIWNSSAAEAIRNTNFSGDTTKKITLINCAMPAPTSITSLTGGETSVINTSPVTISAWESTKTYKETVNGIEHTVYRIEDNETALSGLVGKGTSEGTPEKDQLGNTRNDPPSIGAVEKVETPVVSPTTLTITGTEDTAITAQTITVTKGEDVTWSTSGTLPDGLKAESADKTFTISGTPAVGSAKTDAYTYTVTAKNGAGSTPVTVTITIKAVAPVLDQTGEISKTFTEGVKIEDITIKATAGSNLTWTADSSKLPKGLTGAEAADKASFTISGTPDTDSAGSYTYTVTAASATGDKAEVTYKITVNAAATSVKPVLDTTEKSINAVEGTAIETLTINATAGDNLTWSASGTLPNGLKASSADKTFTISGTPAVGTAQNKAYSYTVKAANSAGEASAVITITVSALTAPALDVTTTSITANEGQEIDSLTITATAGNNLTWTTLGDLPDGLTGTAASDKMSFTISGTPSDSTARMDAYTYSVTAMNTAGSASAVITITVNSTGGINDEVSNALEELAATGESMTLEDALKNSLGLSEEQLKTVTNITIPSNITDLGDLASLLPNLEVIDLTSATSITNVDLNGNTSIKKVALAGNTSVTTLDLRNSAVETVDATDCPELNEVNVAGNTNIQVLSLDECPNVTEIDAEGCENLDNLSASNTSGKRGKLSSMNLKGCKKLKKLGFKGNMMKRFHVDDFDLELNTLDAVDQAVSDVELSRRFSFMDFFSNLLFKSDVSISSKLSEVNIKIAATSGDANIKNVTAYDEDGSKISSSYDPETGEATFAATPARIEYVYDTGFDSEESMDVAISGEGLEDDGDMTLNNSSSGGCNSSFASGALLAFLGFILAKIKSQKR